MSQWMWQLGVLTMLVGFSVASCAGGLPMTPEDAERDWEEFKDYTMVATIDHQIENELAGKTPPGGVESWNKHWILRLKYMRKNLEENQKYINYIIQRRAEVNLPPLEGYPPSNEGNESEASESQ